MMDTRKPTPTIRLLTYSLCGLLALHPMIAFGDVIVDPNAHANQQAQVTQTTRGTPMVNIAAPNRQGLSHNQFQQYDVDNNHLILNNSNAATQTVIGGDIAANANLTDGTAAIILNEVTGTQRSQLQGFTEIGGQAAELIVANPNGITCDGCGFINTPRAVLTTGSPVIRNEQLMSLSVNRGDIRIEGQGTNTGNVDQFDLISRTIQVDANVLAKQLNGARNQIELMTQ